MRQFRIEQKLYLETTIKELVDMKDHDWVITNETNIVLSIDPGQCKILGMSMNPKRKSAHYSPKTAFIFVYLGDPSPVTASHPAFAGKPLVSQPGLGPAVMLLNMSG